MASMKKLITCSAVVGFVLVLNACVVSPGPRGYYPEPYSYSSLVYWYYYPNYGAYYHPADHYYYYQIGGIWRRDSRLPPGWVLSGEPRVRMQLSGIPYQRYSDHRRYYPPRRVTNVMPPNRPHNGDRHDHQDRPDRDDRHGSNDSHQHRPDMDRKDGKNMFVPHTKEKSGYDKRERMEKSDQASSYKGSDKSPLKELKKGSSYSSTKSQGDPGERKQKGDEKRQEKVYRKGKQDNDDDSDNENKLKNSNQKDEERQKMWNKYR